MGKKSKAYEALSLLFKHDGVAPDTDMVADGSKKQTLGHLVNEVIKATSDTTA